MTELILYWPWHALPRVPLFNLSTRRVGGIRFVKVGRLCFSLCITRAYRPL
jgi:hypothetical protein